MLKLFRSKLFKMIVVGVLIFGISWLHTNMKTVDNPVSRQVDEVRAAVYENDWELVQKEIEKMKDLFDERRGRIELFGPIEHVNDTRVNMTTLVEVARHGEKHDVLRLLAKIEARLDDFIIF
ncbi:DUF4363 family protein [Evansella cellulosilytica]|uniref:DUF4363 family protein n=1 Tax=Evansella cellulosilytica (strain ATCC 21833 / DSM 2522 / FERM P-1141 / JCM 9156 / N-4) TaxID=649639 RepID=E6TXG1_EVAC2|nr:DUF4363 family protein [Evansella cellulosilytica]ADU28775.1 hypothetical protein Bcell_0493 [Evansella cellulosilytica DSM 2522]